VIESPHLAPISRPTVTDLIVQRLVNLILDERLKPGDRLPTERDLMAQLSVGRSSLREAIRVLAAIGVVEVSVGEGMFVGQGGASILTKPLSWGLLMSEETGREVIETRRVIESEMAALAARRASPEEIAAIQEQIAIMEAHQRDGSAFTPLDLEFHLAVGRAAHNQVMYHILQTFQHVIRTWMERVTVEYFAGNPQPAFPDHVIISDAIEARDERAARKAMANHLDRGGARLLTVLAKAHAKV
jgi:GntR family transcriptional repressor for pyruvate dehydrogenase complex